MSNRLIVHTSRLLSTPSIIIPRVVLRCDSWWFGPNNYFGRLLVERGDGSLESISFDDLFDGEWDTKPKTTAMLSPQIMLWGFGKISAGTVAHNGSTGGDVTVDYIVPLFNRLEIANTGGGGGGGGAFDGGNGGNSVFPSGTPVSAGGGGGGTSTGTNGTGGTASGGDTNTTGENGGVDGAAHGGDAAGGTSVFFGTISGGGGGTSNGSNGSNPGGGGSRRTTGNGNGGGGSFSVKLWNMGDAGAPSVYTTYSSVAGRGGLAPSGAGRGGIGTFRMGWD